MPVIAMKVATSNPDARSTRRRIVLYPPSAVTIQARPRGSRVTVR